MKKSTIYSVLSAVSACVFLFSTCMAYAEWQVQNDTINVITMASVRGNIIEEYEQNSVVYPDSAVTKIVQVKNTGTIDALSRVKIEKVWGDGRNADGTLQINPDLSTDNILITYNTDSWTYREEDGYFYYSHVLKPEETSVSLFDSFTIDEASTGSEYRNKSADIIVNLEIIQATEDALSYWGTSYEELVIVYHQEEQIELVTKVKFNDPNAGFSFDVNAGDLFAGFKNLVPGEARSQIVEIANDWDNDIDINFWAEYIDQEDMDERAKELVYQMLHEYAVIMISDPDGNVIYHGPIWGNPDVDSTGTDSMKQPLPLGRFKPQEVKRLNVSLTLDSQMNNEDLNLIGRVKWVFSAQGASSLVDDPPNETDIPGLTETVETTTTFDPFGNDSSLTDVSDSGTSTTTNINDNSLTDISSTDDHDTSETTVISGEDSSETTVVSTEVMDNSDTETTTTVYLLIPPESTAPEESTEYTQETSAPPQESSDSSSTTIVSIEETSVPSEENTDFSDTIGSSSETKTSTTTKTNSSGGSSVSRSNSGSSSGGNSASKSGSSGSTTLNNTEYTSTPKTEDAFPIRFYSGLAALSFITMLLMDRKARKNKD